MAPASVKLVAEVMIQAWLRPVTTSTELVGRFVYEFYVKRWPDKTIQAWTEKPSSWTDLNPLQFTGQVQ